jgi:hypothetical protein
MKPFLNIRREGDCWVFEYGDSGGGPWQGIQDHAFTVTLRDGDREFDISVHEPAALEASRAKQRKDAGVD